LVQYSLSPREKLNPEYLILDLKKKTEKQLKSDPSKEPEEVSGIDNVIRNPFKLRDCDIFDRGVYSFASLALEAEYRKMEIEGKAELEVCASIRVVQHQLAQLV
jgi:hypothetical protein